MQSGPLLINDHGHNQNFRLGSLTYSVYLPNVLFAIGHGAVTPVIALVALDLGASVPIAGALVALNALGTVVFDLPAGVLVARIGERAAMISASFVLGLVALTIALGPSLAMFAVLVFVVGCATSVWALARMAFVTEAAPVGLRGRAMSLMGGTGRIGQFVGPLLGALTIPLWGLTGPFAVQALLGFAASIVLLLTTTPHSTRPTEVPTVSLLSVIVANLRALGTAGVASVVVQIMRSTRQAIIPLWGESIGLSASNISAIYGLSSGIELVLFYPVGVLMDRRGRKWAAIPSLLVLAIGMILVPWTSTFGQLLAVGLVMGIGNGLGAGLNLTLGSDFSPDVGRNQFLGAWRLMGDTGAAVGPLLVAGIAGVASLGAAAIAAGFVGFIGAGFMWRLVPETLPPDRGSAGPD